MKITISQAFSSMKPKQFVDWALKNKYDYFIKIESNRETGWIWSKSKDSKQYRFDYNPNK
jgi:hypothetical protein